MAVKRLDDLTVAPIDGGVIRAAPDGRTTTFGVFLELRGVAVAADATPTVTATRGSVSVSLTPDIATTGQVTADLTDANQTTMAAGMLDTLEIWFKGTVTDGALVHTWECVIPVIVTDREVRFPLLLADLEREVPQLKNQAAIPKGQTNWWPQLRLALEDERNWINRQGSGVKDYLLHNLPELRQLVREVGKAAVYSHMSAADNGQSHLVRQFEMAMVSRDRHRAEIAATVKAGTAAWGTPDRQQRVQMKAIRMIQGDGTGSPYGGGPL